MKHSNSLYVRVTKLITNYTLIDKYHCCFFSCEENTCSGMNHDCNQHSTCNKLVVHTVPCYCTLFLPTTMSFMTVPITMELLVIQTH